MGLKYLLHMEWIADIGKVVKVSDECGCSTGFGVQVPEKLQEPPMQYGERLMVDGMDGLEEWLYGMYRASGEDHETAEFCSSGMIEGFMFGKITDNLYWHVEQDSP